MSLKLIGRKKGMTRLFNDKGDLVVCTVISAEPNVISQIKRKETDGHNAIQLASMKLKASRVKNYGKPLQGHFAKAGIEPREFIAQSPVDNVDEYSVGQEIGVGYFEGVTYLDVTGSSKGKGHQGVIKRHNFKGGPASHGSGFHRHGGSTGMRSSPGRCLPGQKKSGHMGDERVTTQNLKVVKVDVERQVILVEGAVPGSREGIVYLQKAKKKRG